MTPERYQTIKRVLDQRQPDLTVITDEVHKGRNLSAIMRSCDAVGIDTMHCVIPLRGFRKFRGTDLGTQKWVETEVYDNVTQPIEHLRRQGFQIVAAHLSDSAVDYRDINYTGPTALLLGAEKEGVSLQALASADHHVTIPMMGMVESFNVAVACSLILVEARHQRDRAGLYESSRMQPERYQHRLFHWCQPVVAAFCDTNGLQYPALNNEGDIIGAPAWYQAVREKRAPLQANNKDSNKQHLEHFLTE